MNKLAVASVLLALFGFSATAHAFHPFEETYGYVAPKKWQKKQKRSNRSSYEYEYAGSKYRRRPVRRYGDDLAYGGYEQYDEYDYRERRQQVRRGTFSGGGRPYIRPVKPRTVAFPNKFSRGTIVIDTARRRLYYTLSSSRAYLYPVAVGKQGFSWTGTKSISRKVKWPDWRPPKEMLARSPELPEHMEGGIRNPLGAVALYLGNSLYRIHGTNNAGSIGTASSSGCIRMHNGHAVHLSSIAGVGTKVHVVRRLPNYMANAGRRNSSG